MPPINESDIKRTIKRAAQAQTPDAWAGIERRINNMNQEPSKKNTSKKFVTWTAAVAACAVLTLAAVTLATKPGFLFGAASTTPAASAAVTPDPQIREPIPFTDNTGMTKSSGPSADILFFETLPALAQNAGTTDIGEFKFIRVTGMETAEDGIAMHTFYEMEVVKVFKGGLKPGDRITVRVFGGAGGSAWIEDDFVEQFTADFEYLFFLEKFDDAGKTVYQLASPLQGYVPLRGGAVSLNTKIQSNGLFTHGEKLADLEKRIEEALK